MALARILLTGPDARSFLQSQLTCDLRALSQSNAIWGAHCNLKGRVEALYQIFETSEGAILLRTPENVAEHALAHLRYYARFSKVSFEILNADGIEKQHDRQADLKNHIAILHPSTVGRFLPQEMGLIERKVVSFNKGCYLGQEVVARLHYLGKLKKTLCYVEVDIPLTPGDTVVLEGHTDSTFQLDLLPAQTVLAALRNSPSVNLVETWNQYKEAVVVDAEGYRALILIF